MALNERWELIASRYCQSQFFVIFYVVVANESAQQLSPFSVTFYAWLLFQPFYS